MEAPSESFIVKNGLRIEDALTGIIQPCIRINYKGLPRGQKIKVNEELSNLIFLGDT